MTILEETIQKISDSNTNLFFKKDLDGIETLAIKTKLGNKAIFIEENPDRSSIRTNTLLLHELSHLECTKSMYDCDTSIYARKRRENIVNKFMIKQYIPVEYIKRLLLKGLRPFEIAEELSIEEKTIKEAIQLYKENGLLD